MEVKTPQSVNLDFILQDPPYQNILYGMLRWVNWQDFVIQPPKFKAVIDYVAIFYPRSQRRQLIHVQLKINGLAKLGLAHVWNKKWLSTMELLWDSGINNPGIYP